MACMLREYLPLAWATTEPDNAQVIGYDMMLLMQ